MSFVVRGSSSRQVSGNLSHTLQTELELIKGEGFRSVSISSRSRKQAKGQKQRNGHPPRHERIADLQVRWGEMTLGKPQHSQAAQSELKLAVVQVFEPNPPPDQEPVAWTLFTSETVLTVEDAFAVVDHYRARWVVEEYFKALKSGCAFQERQLTTLDALLRAMAVLAPIAWQLLMLRTLARLPNPPPATVMFSKTQLVLLGALLQEHCRMTLPAAPTIRDVMLGIARLGGHLPRNGDPGWIVLGRGFEDFLSAERTWRALRMAGEL